MRFLTVPALLLWFSVSGCDVSGLFAKGTPADRTPKTVVYHANFAGPAPVVDPGAPYAPGSAARLLANPFSRAGWVFRAWNTRADGTGRDWAPGATVTITVDTTLYARWTPVTDLPPTSGTAPLAVHFDATDVTWPTTDRPFHELEYRWEFGDPGAGPWTRGINTATSDKNRATGPVAAHVYERPGTYTATLTVFDGSSATPVLTRTYPIPVADPEGIYAGKTVCVSADGDFTGAPSGAARVTSTRWNTSLDAALAAGQGRILFQRGQVFTADNGVVIPDTGNPPRPITIGAFGTGANPRVTAQADNISIVHVGVAADLRLMDFDVDGQNRSSVRALTVGAGGVLALRLGARDLGYLGALSGNNLAVVDCEVVNIVGTSGVMPLYIQDGFHVFVAGNALDSRGGGEYALRYQGGTHGVITHNSFLRCGDRKQMLTLRGDWTQTTYLSGRDVVSDNLIDGGTSVQIATLVGINPQNKERNERISDVIVERNLFVAAPGQMSHLGICARDVTVRNNVFEATGAGTGPMLVLSWGNNQAGLPPVARIQVYHNTFFSDTAGGVTAVGILTAGRPVEDTVVKNNFLYAPHTVKSGENNGGPLMVSDGGGVRTVVAHNSTDAQAKTPGPAPFTVTPPSATDLGDWRLAPGCYALTAGTGVPVWSDLFETPLSSASGRNLGAVSP